MNLFVERDYDLVDGGKTEKVIVHIHSGYGTDQGYRIPAEDAVALAHKILKVAK